MFTEPLLLDQNLPWLGTSLRQVLFLRQTR